MDNSATQATLDTGHRANKITKKTQLRKVTIYYRGDPKQ